MTASPPQLSLSRDWNKANGLLKQQSQLLLFLLRFVRSFPTSGLYKDERNESSPSRQSGSFADFVHYVQTSLANSPRTVLRHAVNTALSDLFETNPTTMTEVCDLLKIDTPHDVGTVPDIRLFVDKMNTFPRGRIYQRWVAAQNAATKPSRWETDPIEMTRRIEKGLSAKAKKEGRPLPSESDINDIVQDSMARDGENREAARKTLGLLQDRLETDHEYLRYVRASELWNISGIQQLWDDYILADKSEGHERHLRGRQFEDQGAAICSCMIVQILQLGQQKSQQQQQQNEPSSAEEDFLSSINDYWYVKGAHWSDSRGRLVGEIDLVVMHKDEVLALCEMKSGCFEVAHAFAQHESKLAARGGGENGFRIVTGSNTVLSLPTGGRDIPLFVATVLPSHRQVLGVEPALSQAICEGIRDQGLLVRDASTNVRVQKNSVSTLLKSGLSRQSTELDNQTKMMCCLSEDTGGQNFSKNGASLSVDLERLEKYILSQLPLDESPAGCLDRCGSRILILKEEDFA